VGIVALFDKPLFIFEMANNHQGSVEHGKTIIRAMKEAACEYEAAFDFAVKFQYRDLDTFIHPDYQQRYDVKNVKRFQETRLSETEFLELKAEVERQGMYTVCTPFDEISVDRIMDQGYDAIKIASCSFGDWPLLERIAEKGLPVIASAAGASLERIDQVVSFFTHRGINMALMHCVAEYPAPNERLEMNQIDLYRQRYPQLKVGFSTHEDPTCTEPVKIAVAKGAVIFEKHVGVPGEGIRLNGYSATPEQVKAWLGAAWETFQMCGTLEGRYRPSKKEEADLAALERGVFAKADLESGSVVTSANSFLAFPCVEGQLRASTLSKYTHISLREKSLTASAPIMMSDVKIVDEQEAVQKIVLQIMRMLKKSHVVIPVNSSCEISHHYGLASFMQTGVAMIDCVNRAYCKKILVVLPGQSHPTHMHKRKEETFTVLQGVLDVVCDGKERRVTPGESVVVERGVKHSFSSEEGCVFEEISTTHYADDSYYDDQSSFVTPRKTKVYITTEMLDRLES